MSALGPVALLQTRLAALGYYRADDIDDDFGPLTAAAYVAALRAGAVQTTDPDVVAARQAVAARVPRQADILAQVDDWLVDDPTRHGYGTWRSEGARADAKRNLIAVDVPLLGRLILDRRAAGAVIAAWGEVEVLTSYRPGRASSMCYRRMDRDPSRPWSVHCTGYAIDVDMDDDGRWERVEAPVRAAMLATLEEWGLVLGARWRGKSRDDMHIQWARLK